MSESQSQQQHVSFNLSEGSHDDDPDGFRNYYAPLSRSVNDHPSEMSPTTSPEGFERDQASPSGTYATSFASEHKPSTHQQRITDQYGGLSMSHTHEIIDQSRSHDTEKVVEVSANQRYVRLNTLLGKGAYKVVYKAIDREEVCKILITVVKTEARKSLILAQNIRDTKLHGTACR